MFRKNKQLLVLFFKRIYPEDIISIIIWVRIFFNYWTLNKNVPLGLYIRGWWHIGTGLGSGIYQGHEKIVMAGGRCKRGKTLDQWFSNLNIHENHQEGLLKQFPGSYPIRSCDSVGLSEDIERSLLTSSQMRWKLLA